MRRYAAALLAVACSSGAVPPPDEERLCAAEARGRPVAGARPSTVGGVRATTVGPGQKPYANAFPGAAPDAFVALCAVQVSAGTYEIRGVREGTPALEMWRIGTGPSPDPGLLFLPPP